MAIEEAGKKVVAHWETIMGFKEDEMKFITGIKDELVNKMVKSIGIIVEAEGSVKKLWEELDKVHKEDDTMITLLTTLYEEYIKSWDGESSKGESSKSAAGEQSKSAASGEQSKSAASGEQSTSAESGEPVALPNLTFVEYAAQIYPYESKFGRRNMAINNLMYQLIATRDGMQTHSAILGGMVESLAKLSRTLTSALGALELRAQDAPKPS